jgi:hypothetical protein
VEGTKSNGAAGALGVDPGLVDLAYARARPFFDEAPRKTAVVVVGCGSSDPDANGDFCKMVRLLGEGRDLAWVVPGFIGIAGRLIDVSGCVDTSRHVFPWVANERPGTKPRNGTAGNRVSAMPAARTNAGATVSRRAARGICRATDCP